MIVFKIVDARRGQGGRNRGAATEGNKETKSKSIDVNKTTNKHKRRQRLTNSDLKEERKGVPTPTYTLNTRVCLYSHHGCS
jgi:hypothetical protein